MTTDVITHFYAIPPASACASRLPFEFTEFRRRSSADRFGVSAVVARANAENIVALIVSEEFGGNSEKSNVKVGYVDFLLIHVK